jgi:hypothetical protein
MYSVSKGQSANHILNKKIAVAVRLRAKAQYCAMIVYEEGRRIRRSD